MSSTIPIRRSQSLNTLLRRAGETDCHKVDSRLPTNFECKIQDSTCISIDDGSSAMCCTDAQDCKSIQPFSCDVERQDISKFPNSPVLTTSLDRDLPTCGANCCPFGYDCITPSDDEPFCSMIVSKSSLARKEESSSSSSTTSTTTLTSTPSTASSSAAAATTASLATTIDSEAHGDRENPFPPGVFLAGLFPGMVVGALLLLAWVIFSGRHKKSDSGSRRHSTSSGRPIISDPIPMTGGVRSDFARRFQDRLSKAKSTFSSTDSNPWKNPTPPVPNNIPEQFSGAPKTPINREREPSLHSIRVYSPPSMVQHPSATVPPLRSMATQRRQPTVDALGSPYASPQQATYDYADPAETLGNQRYEVATQPRSKKERKPGYEDSDESKRDTSFTALMAHCNIPDNGDEFPVPRVPQIPKPYETRY